MTSVGHVTLVVNESFNVIMSVMIALISFVVALSFCFGCMTLCHSRLAACCPSCCGDGHDIDRKAFGSNGTSDGPPYQTFDEENASGKTSGHGRRRGKAAKYEMGGDGDGDEIGGNKYQQNSDGDIEMVRKVARDEL